MSLWDIEMKGKNELKENDTKSRVCYNFYDLINGTKLNLFKIKLILIKLIVY